MTIGGLILCGGQSRRMGRPKAWLPFGSEFLLQRVVGNLRRVVSPVVVVAAPGQDLPTLPEDVSIVFDEHPHRGPLPALALGLQALASQVNAAFVTSCDAPFLAPDWVNHVSETLGESLIALPKVDGIYHPLAAVYRTEVAHHVERLLAEHRFRLIDLVDRVPTRTLSYEELRLVDPRLTSLRNLNTPDDYLQALAELENLHSDWPGNA